MNTPIIFIHSGDSSYLRYTLQAAALFNPEKRVILLGDRTNVHLCGAGVEHVNFSEYCTGPEIDLFDRTYRHIAGEQHGRREWTRFVFRRWFIIHNYLRSHDLQRFWTFDSDTLILTDLSTQEPKFLGYDCTEQCAGCCMNGLVTTRRVVTGYVNKINELFECQEFLENQRRGFRRFPRYAFTEMRAYMAYREESAIKHIRLNTIIDGETFMDSVCTLDEHSILLCADDYALYDEPIWGHRVKKMYLRDDGSILMLHRTTGKHIKLNTINLSWVPDGLFDLLLEQAKRQQFPSRFQSSGELSLLTTEILRQLPVASPAVRPSLPVTEKLLRRIRALRGADRNVYPLS